MSSSSSSDQAMPRRQDDEKQEGQSRRKMGIRAKQIRRDPTRTGLGRAGRARRGWSGDGTTQRATRTQRYCRATLTWTWFATWVWRTSSRVPTAGPEFRGRGSNQTRRKDDSAGEGYDCSGGETHDAEYELAAAGDEKKTREEAAVTPSSG